MIIIITLSNAFLSLRRKKALDKKMYNSRLSDQVSSSRSVISTNSRNFRDSVVAKARFLKPQVRNIMICEDCSQLSSGKFVQSDPTRNCKGGNYSFYNLYFDPAQTSTDLN